MGLLSGNMLELLPQSIDFIRRKSEYLLYTAGNSSIAAHYYLDATVPCTEKTFSENEGKGGMI